MIQVYHYQWRGAEFLFAIELVLAIATKHTGTHVAAENAAILLIAAVIANLPVVYYSYSMPDLYYNTKTAENRTKVATKWARYIPVLLFIQCSTFLHTSPWETAIGPDKTLTQ